MMQPVAWKWEEYFTEWGKDTNGEYKHSTMWDDEKPADHPDIRDVTPLVRLPDAEARIAELERQVRAEKFRADTNDKFLKDHFEASTAKSVEIQNLRAYITKTAKEVAETIDQMRKQDVSVEQRARAEAAEALLKEAGKALEPFAKAADIKLCGEWRDDERFAQTDVGHYLYFGHLRAARAIHHKIGVKDE